MARPIHHSSGYEAAGVEHAVGVEGASSARDGCAASGAGSGANTPARLSRRGTAWRGRRPPAARRAAASAGALVTDPALRAAPFDQLLARQRQRRRVGGTDSRHSARAGVRPPCAAADEELVALVAQAGPERGRPASASIDSPPSAGVAALHRGVGAGAGAAPACRPTTRWRCSGSGWPAQSLSCAQRLRPASSSKRKVVAWPAAPAAPSATPRGSRPSMPSEPASSARHVVAGDVLHHLAAEAAAPRRGR